MKISDNSFRGKIKMSPQKVSVFKSPLLLNSLTPTKLSISSPQTQPAI